MVYTKVIKDDGSTVWRCDYCGFETPERGVMLRHHNPEDNTVDTCPARDWEAEEKEKAIEKELKEKEPSDKVYKERQSQNEILRMILERHPEITRPQMQEIMDWAELKGGLSPFEVQHLLEQMKGLSKTTAALVAQKYSAYLQRAAQEGDADIRMFLTSIPQQQTGTSYTQGYTLQSPTQPNPFQPQFYPPPPPMPYQSPSPYHLPPSPPLSYREQKGVTIDDVIKIIEEKEKRREEETKFEKLEKSISELANTIKKIQETRETQPQQNVMYEVIEEPVDENGNVCHPEKAVSIRRRTVPVTTEQRRDTTLEVLNALQSLGIVGQPQPQPQKELDLMDVITSLKELGLIGQNQITREDIEKIIESKLEKPTITHEDVRSIVEQAIETKMKKEELTARDIEDIIDKKISSDKRYTPEEVQKIIDTKIKEIELNSLKSEFESLKKRYNEIEISKASTPEERVIQQQRMLLENVGETTSKVVSKVIDSVTPIMLRQAGGYPPQSQLPTYTDDEINKIADQLEKGR